MNFFLVKKTALVYLVFMSLFFQKQELNAQNVTHRASLHFSKSFNYKKLAKALTETYQSDSEKVYSIALWISQHINYDVNYYVKQKEKYYSSNKILFRRKAVCDGYSRLFDDMCKSVGLQSTYVIGYDKGFMYDFGDTFFKSEHSWNAFRYNNQWHLIDLTWSAGHLYIKYGLVKFLLFKSKLKKFPFKIKYKRQFDPSYFYTTPPGFITDHFPVVNEWQLLKNPLSITDFENSGLRDIDSLSHLSHEMPQENLTSNYADVECLKERNAHIKFEGVRQLNVNYKNTALFFETNDGFKSKITKEQLKDSIQVKKNLVIIDSLLSYAYCNTENAKIDFKLNSDQNKHKKKLFNTYNKEVAEHAKRNRNTLHSLKKETQNLSRYYKRSVKTLYLKMSAANRISLIGILPDLTLTKKEIAKNIRAAKDIEKLTYKARRKEMHSWIYAGKNDTIMKKDTAIYYNLIAYTMPQQGYYQGVLTGLRAGFADHYDHPVLQLSDTIRHLSAHNMGSIHRVEWHEGIIRKDVNKYISDNLEAVSLLKQAKRECRTGAKNDQSLKTWKRNIELADSILLSYKDMVERDYAYYTTFSRIQKNAVDQLQKLNRRNIKKLKAERFYESCRFYFHHHHDRLKFKKEKQRAKAIKKQLEKNRAILLKNLQKLRSAQQKS